MDIKDLTEKIEQMPDCQSLSAFVVDLMVQVADQRKHIEDELIETAEEIAACITPISYVAYKLKKLKQKLEKLNKYKNTILDIIVLAQVAQAKMQRLGCATNMSETLMQEAQNLSTAVTTPLQP